ncbi:MAG: hypothetical protein DLM61_16425 [Pseudonocardiales bacterium]|nr:MAG: hypothetical protein DLM61_16425 [Pseudonocardiales bacterium]
MDPVADVRALLQQQIARAEAVGVKREQLVLDPGLDFAKSPGDSVEVLRRLGEVGELGRPLLLAVSNKYFVGVVTNRGPVDRVAGTLAAVDAGVKAGATLVRVHDVEEVAAFLRMRAALNGDTVDVEDRSPDERLKWLPLERS